MTYAVTSTSSRVRHVVQLSTHREFSVGVARGAHVRVFVRAPFAEVIKPTSNSNHDLCLAGQNSVARYFKRQSRWATMDE